MRKALFTKNSVLKRCLSFFICRAIPRECSLSASHAFSPPRPYVLLRTCMWVLCSLSSSSELDVRLDYVIARGNKTTYMSEFLSALGLEPARARFELKGLQEACAASIERSHSRSAAVGATTRKKCRCLANCMASVQLFGRTSHLPASL